MESLWMMWGLTGSTRIGSRNYKDGDVKRDWGDSEVVNFADLRIQRVREPWNKHMYLAGLERDPQVSRITNLSAKYL